MQKSVEQALLSELISLQESGEQFLDEDWVTSPVTRYGEAQFQRELSAIFRKETLIALHASELAAPGDFVTRRILDLPLLFTRGTDSIVRCFLNVCRHRGAELVGEQSGCKHRFTCPYHAWTFDTLGNLKGVPHRASGFPGLDTEDMGLVSLPCEERHGWIWFNTTPDSPLDPEATLGDLRDDIISLGFDEMQVFDVTTRHAKANWKFLIEGGLEAYHFKVAHRDTIGALFQNNLSSYQMFGDHIRSVLPRSHLQELQGQARESWNIRQASNLLYTIFPGSQFLVQADHVVWVQVEPTSADESFLRLVTLVPSSENTDARAGYWRKNHDFTVEVLSEDFAIGEGIQRGVGSGANTHFNIGRYEGALQQFNRSVESRISEYSNERS